MKNKNIISLTVVACIILIISLFLISLSGCSQKDYINNQIIDETNKSLETNSNFNVGNYYIQVDNSILKEDDGILGDESIEFSDDNTFNAYTGFGNGIRGRYTISDNNIYCDASEFYSEYGPIQCINASISFKINSTSEIEIIKVSDSYKINVVDMSNNSLTDETKDMSLWPFIEGIKFNLSK